MSLGGSVRYGHEPQRSRRKSGRPQIFPRRVLPSDCAVHEELSTVDPSSMARMDEGVATDLGCTSQDSIYSSSLTSTLGKLPFDSFSLTSRMIWSVTYPGEATLTPPSSSSCPSCPPRNNTNTFCSSCSPCPLSTLARGTSGRFLAVPTIVRP